VIMNASIAQCNALFFANFDPLVGTLLALAT
jgi:hypothetical protein